MHCPRRYGFQREGGACCDTSVEVLRFAVGGTCVAVGGILIAEIGEGA